MRENDSIMESTPGAGPVQRRRANYLQLGLIALAGALAVVVLIVAMTPPAEQSSSSAEAVPAAEPKGEVPEPTISLAADPRQIDNEQLQSRLLEEIEALIEAFPQDPRALHIAAGAYDRVHQTIKARQLWERCIALDPSHVGPRLGLATLMSEKGEDTEAIEILRQSLRQGTASAELYYRLAEALAKVGEVEQAEAVMRRGVATFPRVGINWLLLGQLQNQLQQFAEAERSLSKALEAGYTEPDVYFALANACQRQGKVEEAGRYRDKFSALRAERAKKTEGRPFQEIYQQALRPIVVGTLASAAGLYAEKGDARRAESLLLLANSLEPDDRDVLEEMARFLRAQERMADAHLVHRQLVKLQPSHVLYRINLAHCAAQLGKWNEAEAALEKARELSPSSAIPYLGLAQIQFQQGDVEQAQRYAEDAVKRQPSPQGYALLATIYQQQGDTEAARQARQAAEQLAPQ